MPIILSIDTSGYNAAVIIQKNDKILSFKISEQENKHSEFIHNAIKEVMIESNVRFNQIDACSIINGPGSYTGLRIGLATIKGICYAIDKPLIALNTLFVYAKCLNINKNEIIISSIDARREDLFLSIYDNNYDCLLSPQTIAVNNKNLEQFLISKTIKLIGNGSKKIKEYYKLTNMQIHDFSYNVFLNSFCQLNIKKLLNNEFEKISELEPFYLKETYITYKKI